MVAGGAQDKRATDFLEESMSFTQSTFKMRVSEQVNLSYVTVGKETTKCHLLEQ